MLYKIYGYKKIIWVIWFFKKVILKVKVKKQNIVLKNFYYDGRKL